jgi:hypothetical protein
LPDQGSIVSFKDAEPALDAPARVARYIEGHNFSNDPDAKAFQAEMLRKRVKFTQEWIFSKSDLRNVPDEVAQALAKNNVASNSVIRISTWARTPEVAENLARFAVDFLRAVLLDRALSQSVHQWRQSVVDLANIDTDIVNGQSQLDSLDRLIVGMGELQESQKETVKATPFAGSSVQVQISGSAYLPADQQLIALRSQRLAVVENLKKRRDDLERTRTVGAYGDEMRAIVDGEPDLTKAIAKARVRFQELRERAESIPVQLAADTVLSRLATLQRDYIDLPTNPPQALAYRSGLGLAVSMAIGGAIGILGWIGILYSLFMWGPQLQALHKSFESAGRS